MTHDCAFCRHVVSLLYGMGALRARVDHAESLIHVEWGHPPGTRQIAPIPSEDSLSAWLEKVREVHVQLIRDWEASDPGEAAYRAARDLQEPHMVLLR